ncbi:N-acetylglucosamine-1-phosphodiester alpha-N-acetylglucosaminidase [Biomphalaria pfeifferi]|uniref:N-acetylglucosamine-1-phosphodiester alpha-N-acetylglucosaminidase n=1 Tax=Biomphalaria pfeifferi TaxID=112525 RepID=A0AAD8BBV4_BIOPF|nr:N-acetylglucosamine-1-phosphodiester alpha-N-acetylglucosaminidase [Biomphalaria pfeifferi]
MFLPKWICNYVIFVLKLLIFIDLVSVRGDLKDQNDVVEDELDLLVSEYFQARPSFVHRRQRDANSCQSVIYKNVTNYQSKYQAYSDSSIVLPLVEAHHMVKEFGQYSWSKQQVHIHHQQVNNPLTTWSVLEPGQHGTCRNDSGDRYTVVDSSAQKHCIAAANAGFFNTKTGQCLGNIVSDGFLVQDSGGIQNVHFGLTKNGYIFTGYVSELDLLVQEFTQLVGGVLWLVRDGVNYLEESLKLECSETEETGTLQRFASVTSARTAVGHDREGKIHMIQIDGKTDLYGINLYDFAELLINLGLYNAINLDGGGSATTVINGTLVNFPSDLCVNSSYNCERKVSTIICAHLPACAVKDCSGHGSCDIGTCLCQGHWSGPGCETLTCPNSCSSHGQCTEDGCQCDPGWLGINCSLTCQDGWYGDKCSLPCLCENGASCSPITGDCLCLPGYTGKNCQEACLLGYYGQDCIHLCSCEHRCYCDHITGSCNTTSSGNQHYSKAVYCLAQQRIQSLGLVPDKQYQYSLCVTSVLCLAVIASVSLLLNALLTYFLVRLRQNYKAATQKTERGDNRAQQRSNRNKRKGRGGVEVEEVQLKDMTKTSAARLEEDEELVTSDEEQNLFLAPKKKKKFSIRDFKFI